MRRWVASFGGTGMSPHAPGTAASLASAGVLLTLYVLLAQVRDPPSVFLWNGILIAAVIFFSMLSVMLGPWASAFYGRKDPPPFVLDEVAGICLSWLLLPMYPGWKQAWAALAVFAAFRVFDVWKPYPARHLEKLPAGWGVLMDDLAAAVYANITCQIALRVVVPWLSSSTT